MFWPDYLSLQTPKYTLTNDALQLGRLYGVILRLQRERNSPSFALTINDSRQRELVEICHGCEYVLKIMASILTRYNALSDEERKTRKIWRRVRFGSGEIEDMAEIRKRLVVYKHVITMSLNLCSLGAVGRMEKVLDELVGELEGVRWKVDWVVAIMMATDVERNIWTFYQNDDRRFWRELRRMLVKEGYQHSSLHNQKYYIKHYVKELGNRGVFDEGSNTETESPKSPDFPSQKDGSEPAIVVAEPLSPRTPKYLRFDKRVHVGSIDPQSMKARSPEQQEAHDRRKAGRRARKDERNTLLAEKKSIFGLWSGAAKHKPHIVYGT